MHTACRRFFLADYREVCTAYFQLNRYRGEQIVVLIDHDGGHHPLGRQVPAK